MFIVYSRKISHNSCCQFVLNLQQLLVSLLQIFLVNHENIITLSTNTKWSILPSDPFTDSTVNDVGSIILSNALPSKEKEHFQHQFHDYIKLILLGELISGTGIRLHICHRYHRLYPWRKICGVEKFQISVKNLNSLWVLSKFMPFLF